MKKHKLVMMIAICLLVVAVFITIIFRGVGRMDISTWSENQRQIMKIYARNFDAASKGILTTAEKALLEMTKQVEEYLDQRCPGDQFVFLSAEGTEFMGAPSPNKREFTVIDQATGEIFVVYIRREGNGWSISDTLYGVRHAAELQELIEIRLHQHGFSTCAVRLRMEVLLGLDTPIDTLLADVCQQQVVEIQGSIYLPADCNADKATLTNALTGLDCVGGLHAYLVKEMPQGSFDQTWEQTHGELIVSHIYLPLIQ